MATLTSTTTGFTVDITDEELNEFIVQKAIEAGKSDAVWPSGGEYGDTATYTIQYVDDTGDYIVGGSRFSLVVKVTDETAA